MRIDATSPTSETSAAIIFPDPILCELLMAQTAWMATSDAATLRRHLIRVLAALG